MAFAFVNVVDWPPDCHRRDAFRRRRRNVCQKGKRQKEKTEGKKRRERMLVEELSTEHAQTNTQ